LGYSGRHDEGARGAETAGGGRLGSDFAAWQQFEHPVKPGKVTVPGHPGDEVPRGTLKSIRQQAGWKE